MNRFVVLPLLAVAVAVEGAVGVCGASESGTSSLAVEQPPVSRVETALLRLMGYSAESARETSTNVADGRAEASRCVQSTAAAGTYSSLMHLQVTGEKPASMQWRIDFSGPDKYHVRQSSGNFLDEWITIGTDDYRDFVTQWRKLEGNAGEVEVKEGQRALNKFFAVDKFLHILTAAVPTSAAEYKLQEARYLILDYREQIGPDFTPVVSTTAEPSQVRMWIDVQTHLLVRGDVAAHARTQASQTVVQQTFAGYGQALRIEAPVIHVSH